MRVLVLGGTGFIGRHVAAALRRRGHAVVIGTRHPKRALAKLPDDLRDCELRETHFESLTTRYVWQPLLRDLEVVVNAVGILRERGGETFERVYEMAPGALALACERDGVRLVHVSALGLRPRACSRLLRSKAAAERAIADTSADYSIVRPSLLEGEGGYAAGWLRRLASWPVHCIPLAARGRFAALHVDDLAEAMVVLCETRGRADWREVELGGSARRTLAEHLDAIRGRTYGHPALRVPVPNFLALIAASLCDLLHVTPYGMPVLELLWRDNLPKANRLRALLGRTPTPVGVEPRASAPAGTQLAA